MEEEAKVVEPARIEEAVEAPLPSLGVEDAMALLHAGNAEGVKAHLAALAIQLMPLLKLIDTELQLGMNPENAETKLKEITRP